MTTTLGRGALAHGIPTDEDAEGVTWLEEVGRRGWLVFMKDAEIGWSVRLRRSCHRIVRLPIC